MKIIAVLSLIILTLSGCASGITPKYVNRTITSSTETDGSTRFQFTQYSGVSTDATSEGDAVLIATCNLAEDDSTTYGLSLAHFTVSAENAITTSPKRAVFRVDGNDPYEVVDAESLSSFGNTGDSHAAIWTGSDSALGRSLLEETIVGQELTVSFEIEEDLTYNYTVDLGQVQEKVADFIDVCAEM